MEQTRVKPDLPAGFRDTSPADMFLKRHILATLTRVFESFGFEPFSSSVIQFLSVLFGEDEWTDMSFFRVHNTRRRDTSSRADIGLKFDQTVALGRFVAEHYEELSRPFMRYEIGEAFRGEKPTATRFCQFTQCDVDMIFAPGMISDAQIIALMTECFVALGVNTHRVLLNNRKILNGLPVRIGFPEQYLAKILVVLDGKDKLQADQTLEKELAGLRNDADDPLLDSLQIDELMRFIDVRGTSLIRLGQIKAFMGDNQVALQGCNELEEVLHYLEVFGVDPTRIIIDPSMVRGLGYYTGPIFETVLTDALEMGSMFSGGRYDNLVERFVEMPAPATGAAFGLDRFLVYAKSKGIYQLPKSVAQVMMAYRPADGCKERAIAVAQNLRAQGLNVVLYDGADTSLRPQIGRAKLLEIPWVIIIGEAELASGLVALKEMVQTGAPQRQETMTIDQAVAKLRVSSTI